MVSPAYSTAAADAMASPPTPSQHTKVNPTMAIVLVCLLSAFFMICVVSTYFRHYAERQVRLAGSTMTGSETGSVVHGLDPAIIATFPTFLYSSVKRIKIGQAVLECAVCLNEFQGHETLRLLPKCSHVFHRDCIDMWLASHVTCPVCRADLVRRPLVDPAMDYASTEFLLPITTDMPRSHSTGHSVVEDIERYTLRLPNEARSLFRSISVGYKMSNHQTPGGDTSTS